MEGGFDHGLHQQTLQQMPSKCTDYNRLNGAKHSIKCFTKLNLKVDSTAFNIAIQVLTQYASHVKSTVAY